MKALISAELLRHPDEDVKISVTSCLAEITRITAPDSPYDDEQMKVLILLFCNWIFSIKQFKYIVIINVDNDFCNYIFLFKLYIDYISFRAEQEVFKLKVSAFEKLCHVSGRGYEKALAILENVWKVRSSLVMLDLECDDLVIEMFHHFFGVVRLESPNDNLFYLFLHVPNLPRWNLLTQLGFSFFLITY